MSARLWCKTFNRKMIDECLKEFLGSSFVIRVRLSIVNYPYSFMIYY